jgi:D-sedoheptulose 7-phosphate isomerase
MDYYKGLKVLLGRIECNTKAAKALSQKSALEKIARSIVHNAGRGGKVMIVGNGGSASIASHISIDLLKNARVPSIAFNDSSLLTCISNDLGYENVFSLPIEIMAGEHDSLIAISSSGRSKNILNAAAAAKAKGCLLITLSGFDRNNPLRNAGDINFYVPSHSYGYVEIIHLSICHMIADYIRDKQMK